MILPDQLQILTSRLSQVFSLTLNIDCNFLVPSDKEISRVVRHATQILQHTNRARLTQVLVEFELSSIDSLYIFFFKNRLPLEECKAFEDALLNYRTPSHILVCANPSYSRRIGRARSWHPTVECVFPRLSELGLVTVKWGKSNSVPYYQMQLR